MTCLVTGCALRLAWEPGTHLWGDVHNISPGTLIFNAVLDPNSGEALRIKRPLEERVRCYTVLNKTDVWERRGVLVLAEASLGWNDALADYLGLSPRNDEDA